MTLSISPLGGSEDAEPPPLPPASDAPLTREVLRSAARLGLQRPGLLEDDTPLRIEAPDAASAAMLMREAVGRFQARLVEDGRHWTVVLAPDRPRAQLVLDALDLTQCWLAGSGVDAVTLRLGPRSFRLGPPTGQARVRLD